jgi:hypothetical protein
MAEKAENSHAACVTLTYADNTQHRRDGAAMFCYADVRQFLSALRAAARREANRAKWNFVPSIRFLCAGEQGERNGRCHWHMILYTNFDLSRLGKFRLRGKLVSHRRDMITEGKRKRRLNWTLWPHGFMTLQEPDQGAMSYVLSYCLKDQFTHESSRGTMREAKAENFATGLFRMSKRPAIGESWLMRKLEGLDASGSVLPNLQLSIPDFAGYWHPNGLFREKLLWGLVALNQRALWSTGAPAPQWASLLSSCAESASDMEILNGTSQDRDFLETLNEFVEVEAPAIRAAEAATGTHGSNFTYSDQLARLSEADCEALGIRRYSDQEGRSRYESAEPGASAAKLVQSWTDQQRAIFAEGSSVDQRLGITRT